MADKKPKITDDASEKKSVDRPRAFPIPTPVPDDNSAIHVRTNDDDAVDFGQIPANASGSAVLSHSQISGPLSGTSVVAWTDLMKAHAECESQLQYDSLDNIDLDSVSDEDLLARALAQEPPSGKLNIPKDDRPHGTLSKELIDLDAEENERRLLQDNESVLPNELPEDTSLEALAEAELLDSNGTSHINLLTKNERIMEDDGATEAIDLGSVSGDTGESSAVDLGSEPIIDLPFPSSGISSGSGPRSKSGRSSASRRRGDSSTVDLLTGAGGNGLSSVPGITAIGSSMRPDSGLPATKRVDVMGRQSSGWLAGALVGGLTVGAVCAGVWLSGGFSPRLLEKTPVQQQNQPAIDPSVAAIRAALEQAKLNPEDPVGSLAKLVQDKNMADNETKQALGDKRALEDSQKAMQSLLRVAEAKAAKVAEEKSGIDIALQNTRSELQAKETERKHLEDELNKAKAQMATAKPTPPTIPTTDKQQLTKLKEQVESLQAKVAELEREAVAATRSSESLKQTIRDMASFVVAVRQRLQAPADAKPNELLNKLDTALAAKPTPDLGSQLPGFVGADPRAERAFHRGLNAYRAGQLADAERELLAAVGYQSRDARLWYFLGLTQKELGQNAKAEASFQQALERERRNLPSPDSIDALLERMPPDARHVLNQIRGRG